MHPPVGVAGAGAEAGVLADPRLAVSPTGTPRGPASDPTSAPGSRHRDGAECAPSLMPQDVSAIPYGTYMARAASKAREEEVQEAADLQFLGERVTGIEPA